MVNTDGGITTTEPTPTFVDRNIGLSLLITPRVHADHSVTLRVMQERTRADDPPREIDYGGDNPVQVQGCLTRRLLPSTLVAKSDSMIVLGGLISEGKTETERGVPWLKDVPWIGNLFKSNSKQKVREELMVVLRPYVIAAPGDAESVSRDVLEQLKVRLNKEDEFAILDDFEEQDEEEGEDGDSMSPGGEAVNAE